MARYSYTVLLVPEGTGYVAHVPALPGCVTQGDSVQDALAMAEDAIRGWLHGDAPQPERDGVHALAATVTVEVDVVDGRVRSPGVVEEPAAVGIRG